MKDFLCHSRTKGSKNGVRLYQNEDGTYTELGKQRRRAEYKKMSDDELRTTIKRKKLEKQLDDLEPVGAPRYEQSLNNMRNASGNIDQLSNRLRNRQTNNKTIYEKIDLSKMSDQDLRRAIDRKRLEEQYMSAYGKEVKTKAQKGKEFAQKALEMTSDVLMIGSTALSIALAIKALRNG